MGMFSKQGWSDWARQWGLTYHSPRLLASTREWMVGSYRGYLVKFGWIAERNLEFYALIRFPKGQDAAVIRQRLIEDPSLAELPGWSKIKPATGENPAKMVALPRGDSIALMRSSVVGTKPLIADQSSVVWTRLCPWRAPGPDQLQGWIEKLITALSRVAKPFDGRCEECGATIGERFVMVNAVPVHLCDGCQQALVQKGQLAEQRYEQGEANHLMGTMWGAAAAAAGGAAWAAISYATDRMFALVAIGIAMLVGFAYRIGAKRMDRVGQALGVALTMAGVAFGDIVFYALLIMKQKPEVGFRLDAGLYVFMALLRKSPGDILFSMLCGLIGSIYVARILARPKFVPKIEPAGDEKRAVA